MRLMIPHAEETNQDIKYEHQLGTQPADLSENENCSMAASSKDVSDLLPQKSMSLSIKYVNQKSITKQYHMSNPSNK